MTQDTLRTQIDNFKAALALEQWHGKSQDEYQAFFKKGLTDLKAACKHEDDWYDGSAEIATFMGLAEAGDPIADFFERYGSKP
jgi:hypothetical protein